MPAPAALVQSPLARAAAAEHPVAGVRPPRRRAGGKSQATPALRLTSRGRVVAAFVLGLALWGAASAGWLGVTWLLAVSGH